MHPIIHPGFLKTATTTLQDHLFGTHPGLFSFGRPHRSRLQAEIGNGFMAIDGVDYCEEDLGRLIGRALKDKPPEAVPILSDESFTSNPYLLESVARRLFRFFPDAHIAFTIRHQIDAVRSFYARHGRVLGNVPAPYTDRHIELENWLAHAYRNRPTSILSVFDYDRAIRVYERLFGAERVRIFLFEEFVHNKRTFIAQLAGYLSVDQAAAQRLLLDRHAHAQESARAVAYDRFMKRFVPRRWVDPLLPYTTNLRKFLRSFREKGSWSKPKISAEWVSQLERLYSSGNSALAVRYGLPLQKYGYPL